MPAQDLVIGLDISTTACKAVVVDACGNLLGSGRAPLPMLNPRSGWYEQTADSWWHAVCEALREAARQIDPARVAGLCIAAPRETFVITDVDGQPLADALRLVPDHRGHNRKTGIPRRDGSGIGSRGLNSGGGRRAAPSERGCRRTGDDEHRPSPVSTGP